MSVSNLGLACRNSNCPRSMRDNCKRFGIDAKVFNFVPVRNHPDSQKLFCSGYRERSR